MGGKGFGGLPWAEEGLRDFIYAWVCGHLGGDCLMREYGTPARQGVLDADEVWLRVYQRPRGEHHVSLAGYRCREPGDAGCMVFDRIGIDIDAPDPSGLGEAREAALEALRLLGQSGIQGALQFTGRRGYRVWVFLAEPLGLEAWRSVALAVSIRLVPMRRWGLVDKQALDDPRHMFRVPYLVHGGSGRVAPFLDASTLEPIPPGRWSYDLYEPLRPGDVAAEARLPVPEKPRIRVGARRGGWGWVERVLAAGLPDGRKRFILYVLTPYLANVKRVSVDEAVRIVREFDERCRARSDFRGTGRIYDSWVRSAFLGALEKGVYPPGLRGLRERHPDLYELVSGVLRQS